MTIQGTIGASTTLYASTPSGVGRGPHHAAADADELIAAEEADQQWEITEDLHPTGFPSHLREVLEPKVSALRAIRRWWQHN